MCPFCKAGLEPKTSPGAHTHQTLSGCPLLFKKHPRQRPPPALGWKSNLVPLSQTQSPSREVFSKGRVGSAQGPWRRGGDEAGEARGLRVSRAAGLTPGSVRGPRAMDRRPRKRPLRACFLLCPVGTVRQRGRRGRCPHQSPGRDGGCLPLRLLQSWGGVQAAPPPLPAAQTGAGGSGEGSESPRPVAGFTGNYVIYGLAGGLSQGCAAAAS